MDKGVSLDSAEEADNLVGWACKFILMDLQINIFLNFHTLKREQNQERISLKGVSSFHILKKGRSSTEQLQQYRERKTGMNFYPLKSIKNWRVN